MKKNSEIGVTTTYLATATGQVTFSSLGWKLYPTYEC